MKTLIPAQRSRSISSKAVKSRRMRRWMVIWALSGRNRRQNSPRVKPLGGRPAGRPSGAGPLARDGREAVEQPDLVQDLYEAPGVGRGAAKHPAGPVIL